MIRFGIQHRYEVSVTHKPLCIQNASQVRHLPVIQDFGVYDRHIWQTWHILHPTRQSFTDMWEPGLARQPTASVTTL